MERPNRTQAASGVRTSIGRLVSIEFPFANTVDLLQVYCQIGPVST